MNTDTTDLSSFRAVITRCHQELGQLFFLHQEAVLIGDLPNAIEALRLFTEAQNLHKNFEDEYLLTRLADLDDQGGWPVSLYSHEHRKIEDRLVRIDKDLVRLDTKKLAGTALRTELIELLDREKSFKGLSEHHQEREETGMLPALDKHTDVAWRRSIIEPFFAEWLAITAGQIPRPHR